MAGINLVAEPDKHDIIISRTFDAPRQLVFRAYTDPECIPRWWGPRYLTTTVETMDVQAGGRWRFVQRDPEGNEHAFHGVYHDIVPAERIVQTFEYEGMPGHVALDTATFAEHDGKTTVIASTVFQTIADRDGMLSSGAESGIAESEERLVELLRELAIPAA